jgi:hypothetical protein
MMTNLSDSEIISAQVLLLPASKKKVGGHDQITSENIETFAPPPDAYVKVSAFFESMHFEVGPLIGFTFPITASASTFATLFKAELHKSEKGGIQCQGGDLEIHLYSLPSDVRRLIQAVTFDEPPDFGPTEFNE